MSLFVTKAAPSVDLYGVWSTETEELVLAGTRKQVRRHLRRHFGEAGFAYHDERLRVCDETGTSSERGTAGWKDSRRLRVVHSDELGWLSRTDHQRYLERMSKGSLGSAARLLKR